MIEHDFHIHTNYSDGVSSPAEMVEVASGKGLEVVAITDHGPETHVGIRRGEIGQMIEDVRIVQDDVDICVLLGLEVNILDSNGRVDVGEDVLEELDIVVGGVHDMGSFLSSSELSREYFDRVIGCMESGLVDVLTHPFWYHEDLSKYYNKEKLARFAKVSNETNTAIELNEKYQVPNKNVLSMLKKEGITFCIGTDAHRPGEIGRTRWSTRTLKSVGIERLIVENYL